MAGQAGPPLLWPAIGQTLDASRLMGDRLRQPRIYTRKGDAGVTSLRVGGRVRKDSPRPEAYGSVDEAQAAIGLARAVAPTAALGSDLERLGRDLWVVMAELASDDHETRRLSPGTTAVSQAMVTRVEEALDRILETTVMRSEFAVPGANELSARLDYARAVVRRAERRALGAVVPASLVIAYLNRLSDLLWAMARRAESNEQEDSAKDAG